MTSAPRAVSLVRASGSMAVASLVSRITGFARTLALAAALGLSVVNDSYTVANTLPNIVYELLLGGVLSSVMVPLLVRAQAEDPDDGTEYTQRLLTVATAVLAVATAAAMAAAPLLTWLYLGGGGGDGGGSAADPALATVLALLLLPEIVFYGLGALFGAILNARGVFGPFAWAPVLNNLVMIAVLAAYLALPGGIEPSLANPKVLLLGLGTTFGIVVQALVLVPWLRRVGFRWRPRWGWDRRLAEAGGLWLWVIGYVLAGQAGYIVTTRVGAPFAGTVSTYTYAWLLLQVPYGVLGVSLLTALLPRMSRSAARGDLPGVIRDLSVGSRYSTVALLPVTMLITLFGTSIGVALFSIGRTSEAGAARLGATLAVSAFGLLPFALTMLQLRVFYAMKDARTPTLIQLVIVLVKIPMLLVCPVLLPADQVVLGLAAANGLSFVVGAVLGQLWLRHRLGPLDTTATLVTFGKTALGCAVGGLAGAGLVLAVRRPLGVRLGPVAEAWSVLAIGSLTALVITLAVLRVIRLGELAPLWRRLRTR